MGCVRTLLAIAVVFAHCYGFVFVGGRMAVQLFYIISGFLISYILTESRAYKTLGSFYTNRFLRLFPIYWTVAGISLAMYGAEYALTGNSPWVSVVTEIDFWGKLSLLLSNLILFGQDWIMFTAVHDGVFGWSTNFRESDLQVWKGLLVPQAWTLGVELSFYLIAPFVLTRRSRVVYCLLASIALRGLLIMMGIGTTDPWTYRFFPTELALFLVGALAHQVLSSWLKTTLGTERLAIWSRFATALVATYCAVYFLLPHRAVQTVLLLGLFVLALPLMFHFQATHRWDQRIGELSYPIYIVHIAVILPVNHAWDRLGSREPSLAKAAIVVLLSILAALLLNRLVGDRVEQLRNRVRQGSAALAA